MAAARMPRSGSASTRGVGHRVQAGQRPHAKRRPAAMPAAASPRARGHPAPAGRLHLPQGERPVATRHQQPVPRREHGPGLARTLRRRGAEELDGRLVEQTPRAGRGIEGAHLALEGRRAAWVQSSRAVSRPILGAKVAPAAFCGCGRASPAARSESASTNAVAPELGQARGERARRLARRDRRRHPVQHRPAVQPFVHLHDADTGLALSGENRVLDRRRAAEAGQQRGVHVDHSARERPGAPRASGCARRRPRRRGRPRAAGDSRGRGRRPAAPVAGPESAPTRPAV